MGKLFTKEGTRLLRYAGDGEHKWELRGSDKRVYFTGNAEQLDKHIEDQTKYGEYTDKSKRGRRHK